MNRRTLLKAAALSGLFDRQALLGPALLRAESTAAEQIHTVLLVTKCHLDVGFTQTQAKVIRKYFDVYYPAAIKTAADVRRQGDYGYTWTTGSWLLYEYLEQANPQQRRMMEQAIACRDIAWHALPFNWQTEMLDRSMIEGALSFSRTLDQRFGVKTIGAKMTDVPGHTRALVGPLYDAGIRLLDIGVNAASTPPDVPDLFLWKDAAGKSLAVLYHRHDYGGIVVIPGTGVAVDVEVRGDNSGPHTAAEIAAIYTKLRKQFPGADITPATMSDVAAAVDRVRGKLPVVTSEIGDTWIYGCASDPLKVARYRTIARMRQAWIQHGEFLTGDQRDRNLLRLLLLAPEHTWGTDTKTYLDDLHYRPASLETVLDRPGYVVMETSWKEKRDDIDQALATLPASLQSQARTELASLSGSVPQTSGMATHDPASPITTKHFTLALDPFTGAIVRLRNRTTGIEWASPQHPLALFTYQTLSADEYAAFLKRYLTIVSDWGPKDFGKPGIEALGAIGREWHPRVTRCLNSSNSKEERLVLELAIQDASAVAGGNVAWPKTIYLDMRFPVEEARIDLQLSTFGKVQNRMPEAMWLTFSPAGVLPDSWEVEKAGERIHTTDVVRGGGRAMHAVGGDLRCYTARKEPFHLHTVDAPLIAFGERSPLNFSLDLPNFSGGAHVGLFNNAWGTNYPQWCGGDWVYRFSLFA